MRRQRLMYNLIIGCNIPVHKKCYGVKDVPPGDEHWFCDRF
jgi:hypothetical protein